MRLFLIGFALWILTGSALWGASSLEELHGLRTRNTKVPIYNRNRLQVVVSCSGAEQKGNLIVTTDPVMDIIRRNADPNRLMLGDDVKLYGLGAPFADILQFWSKRLTSDGIVISPSAQIDHASQLIAGSGPVFFRSALLDINGIGFESSIKGRTIRILSHVQIVLRTDRCNPMDFMKGEALPEKIEELTASANTLFIDFENGRIELEGNLHIREDRAEIRCAKMEILLKKNKKKKGADLAEELSAGGVEKVVCSGKVTIQRILEDEEDARQWASAEQVQFFPESGLITLTGTPTEAPALHQGDNHLSGDEIRFYRDAAVLEVNRNARLEYARMEAGEMHRSEVTADRMRFDNRNSNGEIVGNVRVEDREMELKCGRVALEFTKKEPAKETAAKQKKESAGTMTGIPQISSGGLHFIRCYDKVQMSRVRKDPESPLEIAESDMAVLDYPQQILTLSGESRPTITRGLDSLSARTLQLYIEDEKLIASPESLVVLCSMEKPGAPLQKSVVVSDRSVLDHKNNLLTFDGNVRVRDARMSMTCGKMNLHLRDRGKAKQKSPDGIGIGAGAKGLDHIVCEGKVHAEEARMILDCDRAVLRFAESEKPVAPGMFQSGKTALEWIECEGNVRLEDKTPDKKGRTSFRNSVLRAKRGDVDLRQTRAIFHDHVTVDTNDGNLRCQQLALFGRPIGSAPQTVAKPPSIDDDPFLTRAAPPAPSSISIGDEHELDRVVATGDVVFSRPLTGGKTQEALGEQAVYEVSSRKIFLTGTPEQGPRLVDHEQNGSITGNLITLYLENEEVSIDGRTVVKIPDLRKLTK
ncbi:MAG: hypothetical protein J6R85_05235 [Lentisphaeria bacterium]|nr:hypothetical protein [Lentisphaeria bacterium]